MILHGLGGHIHGLKVVYEPIPRSTSSPVQIFICCVILVFFSGLPRMEAGLLYKTKPNLLVPKLQTIHLFTKSDPISTPLSTRAMSSDMQPPCLAFNPEEHMFAGVELCRALRWSGQRFLRSTRRQI